MEKWKIKILVLALMLSTSIFCYMLRDRYVMVYSSETSKSWISIGALSLLIGFPLFICYLILEASECEPVSDRRERLAMMLEDAILKSPLTDQVCLDKNLVWRVIYELRRKRK